MTYLPVETTAGIVSPGADSPWSGVIGNAELTVSAVGTSTAGVVYPNNGCDYGPDTPNTTTSGFNEAMLAAQAIGGYGYTSGGARVVLEGNITGTGQFIFRSGVDFDCLGNIMTCTTAMPTPFITDPVYGMYGENIRARVSPGTVNSCIDTVINPLGGTLLGTVSPYVYVNSSGYYTILLVGGATTNAILFQGTLVSGFADGVFIVPNGGSVTVGFSGTVQPTIAVLSGVMTTLAGGEVQYSGGTYWRDVTVYDLSVVYGNAGNAFLITGGYQPVSNTGGNGSFNQESIYKRLVCEFGAGLNTVRIIGSGAPNHMSAVNSKIEYIEDTHIGRGGCVGYGLNFAGHTDHWVVDYGWLQTDSTAAAGSSLYVFNDGVYFSSTVNLTNVTHIRCRNVIAVTTNTTDYAITFNACGQNEGEGWCEVEQFDAGAATVPVSVTWSGGSTWGKAYCTGSNTRYWTTNVGLITQVAPAFVAQSDMAANLGSVFGGQAYFFADTRATVTAVDATPITIFLNPNQYRAELVFLTVDMNLYGAGTGAATYVVTYVTNNNTSVPVVVSGSAVGDYSIGPMPVWIAKNSTITGQITAVGSPAWNIAIGCVVVPVI